jgi:hypothetical protein
LGDLEKLAVKRLRMLRIGEGWSAETLAQKYEKSGAGELTRTMIAKNESETRQINPGELEGLARIFGLTSTALLAPDGPAVFLSYAGQDDADGQEVATWLSGNGFRVSSAGLLVPEHASSASADRHPIDNVQAYVALLSPGFLSSPRCQAELELAVRREQKLAAAGRAADFIHLLRVASTPDLSDPSLKAHSTIDLGPADDQKRDDEKKASRKRALALSELGGHIIIAAMRSPAAPAYPQPHLGTRPAFLDRDEELKQVLFSLDSSAGSQFWLVTSPPGLGKTRFLEQLAAKANESAPGSWLTRNVDLRADKAGGDDAVTVAARLFDIDPPWPAELDDDDLVNIARRIINGGRPWLCLLDGAELLPESAVTQLRHYLSTIHRVVSEGRNTGARLAFVVGSRRDDGWKGVWPSPPLSVLPLGGFRAGAVQSALEGLAQSTGHGTPPVSATELQENAVLLQQVTEGVPELVERGLEWIEAQDWLAIGRLKTPQLFDRIIAPYIRDRLLVSGSLFPEEVPRQEGSAKQLKALVSALRLLAPFRFFTLSHVSHFRDHDPSFQHALDEVNWSVYDLWQAIAGMALLRRPLDEPWQEIHPALRRLLFRYFYTPDQRANAHEDARDFSREWAAKLPGKERVIGMVESIWHEAARLRLSNAAMMREDLTGFVRKLSVHDLSVDDQRNPYAETELRDYAARRMKSDDELQREVADAGLFEEIVQSVLAPKAQEG